jgi:predicted MFS family arabinose efflux permease
MSTPPRPFWILTKTGSVLPAVLEAALGVFGLVVQIGTMTSGRPVEPVSYVVLVVALLLIAQGVADLVWWSRDDRRAKARQG